MGTVRMAALQSKLPEYPDATMEGEAHVLALVERFAQYATTLRNSIALATDVEDAGSAAICTDISRGLIGSCGSWKRISAVNGYAEKQHITRDI